MNHNEGARTDSQNSEAAEDIKDYTNSDLREILESAQVVATGDLITADDYNAIRSRAEYLAENMDDAVSAKTMLIAAYVDRMRATEKIGDKQLKTMSDDAIRGVVFMDKGLVLTTEEIERLRNSPLSFKQWEEERAGIIKGSHEFDVAVDGAGSVVARGAAPEEALRRAQDANGKRI